MLLSRNHLLHTHIVYIHTWKLSFTTTVYLLAAKQLYLNSCGLNALLRGMGMVVMRHAQVLLFIGLPRMLTE